MVLSLSLLLSAAAGATVDLPSRAEGPAADDRELVSARRELQRTATGARISQTLDDLTTCTDDSAGFMALYGMTCSAETRHQTQAECESAGFTWADDHGNSLLHHCRDSTKLDMVHDRGCGAWFLQDIYTVADMCPFSCFGCDEHVRFDALNRLFMDLTINAPDILISDVANTAKDSTGLTPVVSIEINDLTCYDISLGNIHATTDPPDAPRRAPRINADGSPGGYLLNFRQFLPHFNPSLFKFCSF